MRGTQPGLPRLGLVLYQPDRPHNFGSALRLCACFGVTLGVIEPCGFPLDDRRIRQTALDYHAHARWVRHQDFAAFETARLAEGRRLVLLSTRGEHFYHRVAFRPDDVLLLGRESAGVPEAVHVRADLRVKIPMRPDLRSLNVVTAAAIVLAEALRQTGGFHEVAL
ncbi:tRNA (cytidine(34)-2'-O)-methyltransferase [Benzoatithermus flavus]|uniref:tRNA (cytidine(34)-2'-O)-methyltransferase n=1 Tax=Benzoatithermus flavus TaxID=3108223 RepID=A0ABU8XQ97_9PROT